MDTADTLLHFLPGPDIEDIKQEIAIAEWLGIKKHRAPRSAVFGREMGYGFLAPDGAMPLYSEPCYNPEAMEQVITWMFEQADNVQTAVLSYLSDPTDRRLKTVLALIDKVERQERIRRPSTLVDLILRVLPASKEDLYQMARRQHNAKRPEAAVRQIIRRLTYEGRIFLTKEGIYDCPR